MKDRTIKMMFGAILILMVSSAIAAYFVLVFDKSARQPVDHLGIARDLSSKNDFAGAEKEYLLVQSENENNEAYWRELGYVYQQQKKRPEAISAYGKSLKINDKVATTYNLLGNLHRENDNLEKAVSSYQKALDLSPNLLPAVINLNNVFLLQNKTDESISLLVKYYDGSKARADIGLQLASVYKKLGKMTEARQTVAKILEIDPNNEKAQDFVKAL